MGISAQSYLPGNTQARVPESGYLDGDVVAQDLDTAIKALGLMPEVIEYAKVYKSSGKIGTAGDVSAGWSKCTEPLESAGKTVSGEQELLDFQFRHCEGCFYGDQAKVGTGKPCCTFITTPHIVDGKCLTRKGKDPEAQMEDAADQRDKGLTPSEKI